MATLSFTDRAGTEWTIWRVVPGEHSLSPRSTALPEELAEGWLCFECASEKRRVYPVPPDLETLPPDKLAILCRAGVPVLPRSRHTEPAQTVGSMQTGQSG
jgi:hypothetical protein